MPSVLVAGASGYAGALAAALLQRHPRFDLVAVTSRSDVGTKLSDLYPYHRVALEPGRSARDIRVGPSEFIDAEALQFRTVDQHV